MRNKKLYWVCSLLLWLLACLCFISVASASQFYVARGDTISIPEQVPNGSCWYFPTSGTGIHFDIPSVPQGEEWYCRLSETDTKRMTPSTYTLLYQEPVFANEQYFKDVSWIDNKLVSSFSQVESIDEAGKNAPDILNDLKNIILTNNFNTFSIDQVIVQEPAITVRNIGQTGENIYTASGTSNYANNTPVTVKIDENRYFAQHDESFTYSTIIYHAPNEDTGRWTANILMPLQTMPAGWHNLTVYAGTTKVDAMFKIDEREWSPAPTPTQYVKYLWNGDIEPDVVTVIQTQIVETTRDVWHTATPTPAITDALGKEVGYPYTYGDKIPKEYQYIALGVLVAGVVGLFGLRKLMDRWDKK